MEEISPRMHQLPCHVMAHPNELLNLQEMLSEKNQTSWAHAKEHFFAHLLDEWLDVQVGH